MGEAQIYNDVIFEIMAYSDITDFIIRYGPSTYYQTFARDPVIKIWANDDRSTYGFVQSAYNGTTYLASDNVGLDSTVATMKLAVAFEDSLISGGISTAAGYNIRITYISNGENNYDYALFSEPGLSTFSVGATDGDSGVYKSAYGESSDEEQTLYYYIPYSSEETNIFINYRKDGSQSQGLDRLYMRIAVEATDGGGAGYYYIGERFNAYRGSIGFSSTYTGIPWSSITVDGWPPLDSGVQMDPYNQGYNAGTLYLWSSGYSETAPFVESDGLPLLFSATGHKSASTIESPTVKYSLTSSADIRTRVYDTEQNQIFLRTYSHTVRVGLPRTKAYLDAYSGYSDVLFTISNGNVAYSAKTGSYGYATVYTSAFTENDNLSVTIDRPGGLPSYSFSKINQSGDFTYLFDFSGNNYNTGQVATIGFIVDNISSAFTQGKTWSSYSLNTAIRPNLRKSNASFAYGQSQTYGDYITCHVMPYSAKTNEIVSLPYISSFGPWRNPINNGAPGDAWTGNTVS